MGPHGKFKMGDGDWICSDPSCGNVNFARRTSCNRCKKDKPVEVKNKAFGSEIGKVAAERSRGLFSAEDWQCNKCGNINWARRSTCNMCNSPKVGDAEERTGYGGGFNERGNVEYVARADSDDEYDEFGRKKKQYRDKPKASNSSNDRDSKHKQDESKEKIVQEESNDDEEEDDDDDGDISKYDLSGWGDDDEDENAKEPNSRSRSTERTNKEDKERARSRSPISRS